MNLKVAVVDDEAPIRQWLTYCIGTIAPEDKISTAANGAEALEMMEQVQPDVVFTDICMPVMDGLELMRQAKKKLPFTKFVILTNYAEFSYAKEALSLGAWEYILKSEMRAADIKNLLDKTRAQAEKIRRTKVDGVFPSGHLDLYEIYNTADAADASERILQRLGAREGAAYRVCAVPNGNSPKSWMVYSELAERFRRETGGFALVASERTYEYLLFQPDGDNVAQILAGTGISFGTSSVSAALRDFPVLLRQGAAALDAAFFGGVTDYEALAARRPLDRGRIHEFKKQFMQLLQDYRFPEALDTLQGWKNAIGQPAAGDVSWAMEHSRRMVLLVEEQYCRETESGLSKEELPDTLEACVERCRSLVAKMQESSRTSTFIDTAVCYIRAHYSEDLSLARVAQAVYRSPEYFSRQFKEEMGENFSVYLTLYRLERAQELLNRTDLSIAEIANRVGYANPGYFTRIYKKYRGITPEQARMTRL